MSRELIEKHPDIRRYTTIWMDTLRDGTFQLANTNKLIRFYDGATGLKTGSTDSAKYCLSATAEREGMELIAVVLKSPTGQQRFEDAKALLNYGFSTYALLHTVPEEPFPAIPVVLGETETVQPCIDPQEAVALLQKSQVGGLSQSVTLAEQVENELASLVDEGGAVHPHPGGAERGAPYLRYHAAPDAVGGIFCRLKAAFG